MVIKKIGLIANHKRAGVLEAIGELVRWLEDRGRKIFVDDQSAKLLSRKDIGCPAEEIPDLSDMIIVLGGDGTVLRVARLMEKSDIPILAVNIGGLGFLTVITLSELYPALEKVLNHQYQSSLHMILAARVVRKGKEVGRFTALNDVVITKGAISRLIDLGISIGQEYVTTYAADGLIISTPTGSTAHSLSAGGPIVHSTMDAIILTPICPHTLTNRPLILSERDTIYVALKSAYPETTLTMDGQVGFPLKLGDVVEIEKAPFKVRLIKSAKKGYYGILREKLSWGGRT